MTVVTSVMTLIGMAFGSAVAQPAASPPPSDGWVKICITNEKVKKEQCQTGFDLRTSTGQFLATVQVMETVGEARKVVRVIVPTGMLLQPGIRVQVDDGKAEEGKFGFCAPEGCVAQVVASDAFVNQMKAGKQITVNGQGQAANPIAFNFPLADFKSTTEGKPIDAETFKKRQEAIARDIQEKRATIEKQLQDAQKKAIQAQ